MALPIVEGGGREEYVYFSDPVSYLYSVLWKRKDRDISWSTYEDLSGLVIGAAGGYHYGAGFQEAADAGIFTIEIQSHTNPDLLNFKKAKARRIDMFICEINVGRNILKKNHPEFEMLDYVETGVGTRRPFSLAVSKKYFKGKIPKWV